MALLDYLATLYSGHSGAFYHRAFSGNFQDFEATTPADVSDPVGFVENLIEDANHAVSTDPVRPILTATGYAFSQHLLAMDGLATIFSGTDQPFSALIYAQHDPEPAQNGAVLMAGNSGSNTPIIEVLSIHSSPAGGMYSLRRDNSNALVANDDFTFATGNLEVFAVIYSGTHLTVWQDDQKVVDAASLDNGALTVNLFTLGAFRRASVIGYWTGEAVAWGVMDAAWTDQEYLDLYDELVGGSEPEEVDLSGSVTASGSTVLHAQKVLSGVSQPAGLLIRRAGKGLAGSVAAAGTIHKATTRLLAGAVTTAGALNATRTVMAALMGSVTASGGLHRQAAKALAGATAPTGGLTRQVRKMLAGVMTPVGALIRSLVGVDVLAKATVRDAAAYQASVQDRVVYAVVVSDAISE